MANWCACCPRPTRRTGPRRARYSGDAASTRLFAPACTTRFAVDHYLPAVQKGVLPAEHFHIHTLSDKNELDDTVGPYRKSLLYLVSRALDDARKMPLLGMERAHDPQHFNDDQWASSQLASLAQWHAAFPAAHEPQRGSREGIGGEQREQHLVEHVHDDVGPYLAQAFAASRHGGMPFFWKEKSFDHDDKMELLIGAIQGTIIIIAMLVQRSLARKA